MLPVWFFIVLMLLICYLLFVIRTPEETVAGMNKNQFKRIQFWMKELATKK